MSWDWEDAWILLGFVAVIALFTVLIVFVVVSPTLRGYYLSPPSGHGNVPAVCVCAEWRWLEDDVVFCSDDYNKALDFVERANKTLRKP
jgi:hypothetical protein